jgi:ABC-type dipeptide/oligopeptide/nickel transport system permease subunit
MISDGRQFITFSAWITGVPGMALAVILIALNVLGDGLRQKYDPNVSNS